MVLNGSFILSLGVIIIILGYFMLNEKDGEQSMFLRIWCHVLHPNKFVLP